MGGLVKHPQCPFCREDVAPADAKAACDGCMAWHHAECWGEHARCSACGAASALGVGDDGGAAAAGGSSPGGGSPAPALGGPLDRLDPAERALAGYLGHPAARDDVPPGAPTLAQGAVDLAGWVAYLARWGEEVLSRAALAAARQALTAPSPPGADAALAALEDWLSCPCVRHQRLAHAAADAVAVDADAVAVDGHGDVLRGAWSARAARFAARTAGLRLDLHGPIRAQKAVDLAAAIRAHAERGATEPTPPERAAVRAAVSDELLAWLLADRRSSA